MIRIASDHWRLWCNPDRGVQWMAADVRAGDRWHAVVPDCRTDGALPAASFHMLPYSNRIRDGRFEFQGQTIQLAEGDQHAIHGALRKLSWQVVSNGPSSLICTCCSVDYPELNWPWPIEATIAQEIDGDTLSSTMTLTNCGDTDMPAGLGWHPYFVRHIDGFEPTLTLPVSGLFPDENGDCLPDGPAGPLPATLDFRQPRRLDAAQRIDCCLAGLDGPCFIDWQGSGVQLIMRASEVCRYLVLFNPDMPHFAVEPVTNANDAFNLAARGIESGVQVLPSGQSLQASMSLQVIVKDDASEN